jgi:hypothetical protein
VRRRGRPQSFGRPAFHVICLVASATAALLCDRAAHADPQASLGLTLGGAFEAQGPGPSSAVHLGGRADVLFLRGRERDMAVGPYVDVAAAAFHDFDLGGGGEWLVPVTEDLPLVLSAGVFARNGQSRQWAPGAEGTLFFGSRSYNFHSWYGLAVGGFVQGRWLPSSPETVDLAAGVQVDAELLLLPFLFAYTAITH